MRRNVTVLIALLITVTLTKGQRLPEEYLQQWKHFYPSKAVRAGMHASIYQYEVPAEMVINSWININRDILEKLEEGKESTPDARLLRVQAQSEIDLWDQLKVHQTDLNLYLRLMSDAISPVVEADYLTRDEKGNLICERLRAILKVADAGGRNLKRLTQKQIDTSEEKFDKLIDELAALPEVLVSAGIPIPCSDFEDRLKKAQLRILSLERTVNETLINSVVPEREILGREEYARQLALYTDSDLTPEQLSAMALEEIELVRGLMIEVSTGYLKRTYPNESLPQNEKGILEKALGDMGKDVPKNSSDYEQFWNELAEKAQAFVKEKGLGSLPKNHTLTIRSAPESAGPAARIGWVGSAPPFDPNPWTTLFLPSIPETFPLQEQKDFWASFNKPFNRIIVIHELFPGHYMQLKISRETAHPIRLLFPFGIYIEGWATFCERVALDEGWDAGNDMTLLAHLRKRIENANRAYTSVQVHTQSWTQDQVMKFSTETSLVAPQFAKSLWFRLMRSPMQLTSYFLGGAQFSKLLEYEKARLGDQFDLTLFMDTIMKAGPIPIDEFYGIFASIKPR